MRFAITPKGVGRRPGARSITDGTPLAPGETFTVTDFTPALVLAEDGLSLREKTPEEIALEASKEAAAGVERAAQQALAADAKLDAVFDQLKTATAGQIATFVSNRFPAFDPDQRAVIRLLLKVAALVLRRAG